jgi:hypothetical protein
MGEILSYAAYILLLGLFFGILALIGYVGITLRYAYEYGRRGDPRVRSRLLIGAVGLLTLGGGGVALAHLDGKPIVLLIYGGIVLILLVLGWSGRLIVPEGFGDH